MEKWIRRGGFESLDYNVLNLHNEQNLIIERIKNDIQVQNKLAYTLPLLGLVEIIDTVIVTYFWRETKNLPLSQGNFKLFLRPLQCSTQALLQGL